MRSQLPSVASYLIGALCIGSCIAAAFCGFWLVRTTFNDRLMESINFELAAPLPSTINISRAIDIYKRIKSTLLFLNYDESAAEEVTTSEAILYAMTALNSEQPESAIRTLLATGEVAPTLRKILADFKLSKGILTATQAQLNDINLQRNQIATDKTNIVQPEVWVSEYKLIRDGLAVILGMNTDRIPLPKTLSEEDFYKDGVLYSFPALPGITKTINSLEELTSELDRLKAHPKTPANLIPDKVNALRSQSIPLFRNVTSLYAKLSELDRAAESALAEKKKITKTLFVELNKVMKSILSSEATE
jgi:hypothetical protein